MTLQMQQSQEQREQLLANRENKNKEKEKAVRWREWYHRNPDKVAAYRRKRDKQKHCEYNKNWYWANHQKALESCKKSYYKNRQKKLEYMKEYRRRKKGLVNRS